MSRDNAGTRRVDPYKNFRFRLRCDGRYVAGVDRCNGLKPTTDLTRHRDGRDSKDATKHRAITLERGVTHDPAFDKWARTSSSGARRASLKDLRKNVTIEVYDEAGQLKTVYKVFECWVSEYQGLPDLDANANAVAIQSLKLEHEGWKRDDDISEQNRPSLTKLAPRS